MISRARLTSTAVSLPAAFTPDWRRHLAQLSQDQPGTRASGMTSTISDCPSKAAVPEVARTLRLHRPADAGTLLVPVIRLGTILPDSLTYCFSMFRSFVIDLRDTVAEKGRIYGDERNVTSLVSQASALAVESALLSRGGRLSSFVSFASGEVAI